MDTVLPDGRAILAVVLIGILALVTYGPSILGGLGGGRAGYDYDQYYDGQYNSYAEDAGTTGDQGQSAFYARNGQQYQDLAAKMFQLETAFKKYQVQEDECRAFVACEAAQLDRLEQNGPLVQIVNKVLSEGKNLSLTKHTNMAKVKEAFDIGLQKHFQKEYDACRDLRTACQNIRVNTKF